jgi:hypothetical protein
MSLYVCVKIIGIVRPVNKDEPLVPPESIWVIPEYKEKF